MIKFCGRNIDMNFSFLGGTKLLTNVPPLI